MKRKLGIIIEGSDCSGKTTLVNRLRSQLSPQGWYSLSVSHRAMNQFDRYLTKYLDDEHTIYDRSHFSSQEAITLAQQVGYLGRHQEVSKKLSKGIHLAYDGLQISV